VVFIAHFISTQTTATADTMFRLVTAEMWLEDVNITATANDAYYGDNQGQDSKLSANDVISYRVIDLSSIYFKNFTAGSNTVITAAGVKISPERLKVLGIK
jgi:hypothetical protein